MPAGGSESRMPMATSLWTRSRPVPTHTGVQPCRPPECVLYRVPSSDTSAVEKRPRSEA